MSDGTRTRDTLDHNQVLYQLSYTHHAAGTAGCADECIRGVPIASRGEPTSPLAALIMQIPSIMKTASVE